MNIKGVISVRVFRAQPSMWYNDKINQTFTVICGGDSYFKIASLDTQKIIFKIDCIVL